MRFETGPALRCRLGRGIRSRRKKTDKRLPVPFGHRPNEADRMSLDQQIAAHYEELKRLAHRMLLRRDTTVQTTGLVHELFLKLRSHGAAESEAHLMNLAARAMRQVLVDAARRRASEKRGGGRIAVTLTDRVGVDDSGMEIDVLAIEQSLQKLELSSPQLARVVELHFFGGMGFPEISRLLGVAERTVFRYWRTARAMIQADLTDAVDPP